MKIVRLLPLAVVPLLGMALLVLALLWGGRGLVLRWQGVKTEGQLTGMLVTRPGGADLVRGVATEVELRCADGSILRAFYRNHVPLSGEWRPAGEDGGRVLGAEDLLPTTAGEIPGPALVRCLDSLARGGASSVRWALRRESRRKDDPRRVVAVLRQDRMEGWFGKPAEVLRPSLAEGRLVPADAAAAGPVQETVITARFDRSDAAALAARKGETLVDYTHRRPEGEFDPVRRDFYLHAEPYSTEFRPVYEYTAGGIQHAALSHIGRFGGPTLALLLFGPGDVYHDPHSPGESVIFARPGPLEGSWLDWLSRFCEGLFGQWGGPAVVGLLGACLVAAGMLQASLVWFPSRHLGKDLHPETAAQTHEDASRHS